MEVVTYNVLFVCAGNEGRSPLAEVIARRYLAEALGVGDDELETTGFHVFSAGTHAPLGVQASARGAAIAKELGITMGVHPSRRLDEHLVRGADVVFCMDLAQMEYLAEHGIADKAELLDPTGREIPDPRGQDVDFYREVRDQIVGSLQRRLPQILTAAGGGENRR